MISQGLLNLLRYFIGKEGNACYGRSFLASFLYLLLYMSGEELIWEAAMMIF